MPSAVLFEEHASVLAHWLARGVRGATLVCLDAHLDLQFLAPEKIDRLARCGGAADLLALESPHPLDPSREACFGIEDFLFAASQLGIVRRLVWVAPPHVLDAGFGTALSALQQMEGVTLEQLESFRVTPGGWLEGELLGLPMAIGRLEQLAALQPREPVLLDIDADYFVKVPNDRLWCSPTATCRALRAWLGDRHELTIARSAGTGFLPPALSGIAELLAACWEGREEEARRREARLLSEDPGVQSPPDDDLLAALGAVRARAQAVSLAGVRELRRRLEHWDAPPRRLAAAWNAMGLLQVRFGRLREAIDCSGRAAGHGAPHPELALEIGRLHLARGEAASAEPWLTRAADDDETRVQARLLLADCALHRGDADGAIRHAGEVLRAAPAWTATWPRLAAAAALKGDREAERAATLEGQSRERRVAAVAQRLAAPAGRP